MARKVFQITFDQAFDEVIIRCSSISRKGQDGTWITDEIIEGYRKLHELGYAHSVETWQDDELCGGLYGISLGKCFFGESMFSLVANASKNAFAALCARLIKLDFQLIDCQVYTPHLATLGATEIPREVFYAQLKTALDHPTLKGSWANIFSDNLTPPP